jgi:hypothetical protein
MLPQGSMPLTEEASDPGGDQTIEEAEAPLPAEGVGDRGAATGSRPDRSFVLPEEKRQHPGLFEEALAFGDPEELKRIDPERHAEGALELQRHYLAGSRGREVSSGRRGHVEPGIHLEVHAFEGRDPVPDLIRPGPQAGYGDDPAFDGLGHRPII